MKNISIIILAAGFGTRMKSVKPKILHEISGFPMIYYSIKEAKKLSDDIKVVLYHKSKLIIDEIKKYFDNIEFIIQDVKNFPGTGGALKNINFKRDKILILNGDMPLVESTELKKFMQINADIVISIISLKDPNGYGRVLIQNDKVIKIIEEKDATKDEKNIKNVNAGVYLIKKELLEKYIPKLKNKNLSKEFYLTDIIEFAQNDKKTIKPIYVNEKNFKGVNSKLDLSGAEKIMQKKIKDNLMKEGITLRLPETIYIESEVEFAGECIVENGVSIYKNSKIINSHIKTNSVIEDSVIENSSVGPMARIRPGSHLKNTHIGNFTEVKKSTLIGVKAGHLSYLGDSFIDEGTNIGAGTITCNYDGKKKYKTKIGKNVFIGSDTQIVAPVTIEDDVIIAAGTTVTKDIKKGSLAINRAPLKIIKNFFYKFFEKEK
jgi:bifunctional UDP-N-acetylglucosamine pyrophosphorylase/glucosamine-1-phosphate N-acetyltransferase